MSSLPKRPLGRTGHQVSILALGGVMYNFLPDDQAAALVHRAIDLGINYIDTAYSYKDSERKIGQVLVQRRQEVFLATKTERRDRAGAAAEIEQSFARLQTDRIDCLQLHAIHTEKDLAAVLAPGGALEYVRELQQAGRVRFVGITGHADPAVLAQALEAYPFDTVLAAMGAMHEAVRPFHDTLVPVAQKRGVGVLAMKVMASGMFKHCPQMGLRFSLDLPGVSSAVVGVDNLEQLEANVAWACDAQPLTPTQRQDFLEQARDLYKHQTKDAWFIIK